MAMEAGAMSGGTIPSSPLRSPAPTLPSPPPAASPLHQSIPPVGGGITSLPLTTVGQGGQAASDLEHGQGGQATGEVLKSGPSSKTKRKKKLQDKPCASDISEAVGGKRPLSHAGEVLVVPHAAGEVGWELHAAGELGGELHASVDVRGKQQISAEVHGEVQRKNRRKKVTTDNSKETSPTAGSKRPFSEASGSIRASKAAKIINAKVVRKQLENKSKTARKNMAPIVSSSPILNRMARQKAQSYARSPRLHARSPNSTKSPSLHDLSPAPALASNGSKRRPQKLTSVIWNCCRIFKTKRS